MPTDALVLDGVTKRYAAKTAVDGLSFRVPRGCIYGFIGPNGAGKTTTLRMILDILRPDEGRIEVLGQPHAGPLKDRIGYLPEERGLYKKMRLGEVLRYFAGIKGADPRTLGAEIRRWLERFDLVAWERHRVEALSKGMQQKAQFIATVLHKPDLLILDEPFSGLDPANMIVLKDAILGLKRQGCTILFSTHVMEVAEKLCDSVLMVHAGRKVLDGPLDVLLRRQGESVVILEYQGDGGAVRALPGVAAVNDYGQYVELRLAEGTDPQHVLRSALDRVRVSRFETRRTSLTEIFLRQVGGAVNA